MFEQRFFGRRALLLVAGMAIVGGGFIVAGRLRRGSESPAVVRDGSAPSARPQRLRVESLVGSASAPKPLASARTIARTEAASTFPSKTVAPFDDSPEAHATMTADQRAAIDLKQRALFGRQELLKERDGSYAFASRTYGTTIGQGRVDLVVPSASGHRFSYQFSELRAGGAILARGGDVQAGARPDERAVSFHRGDVEERYLLRPDALEQTFVVRSLPAERGALTVTGRVSTTLTPPASAAAASKLSFSDQGREVLSISEAAAVDAAGKRQELQLAYADGTLTMTVPAEWVAVATLPITIDPLMGGAIEIDASVTAVAGVAYNAADNEWLVVWQEQFGASAFNSDIYAQRVSATGALLGGAIPVASSAAGESEPVVSWASGVNRYLVAWRHDPADDASDADQFIAGAVLNADGSLFSAPFTLDDAPGQDYGPSLLFDGARWLCVFTNVVSATDHNALGRFVSVDGLPGAALTLDADADLAEAPSVGIVGTTYLAAWQKGSAGGPRSIVARTMDGSGAFLTPLTAVDKSANDCVHPDVSSGGGQFLIVWQQAAPPTDHNVVGRLATTALTFPKNPFNVRAGVNDQLTPRAAFAEAANVWYVVYSDTTTAAVTNLYGSRVDTAGKVFGANKLTSNTAAEFKPELAWNPVTSEMLVAFLQGDGSPFQAVAQRVSLDFTAPTVPGTPVVTPNPHPTGSYTVVWAPTLEAGGSGFSHYDLQRSANGGTKWTLIASPTTESFADNVPHGEYLYRVRASDNAGNRSAFSAVATVVVDPAPPAEPIALQQFRADGTTPIAAGGSAPDGTVVLSATVHDLGLLDGFEDSNFTLEPIWTVGVGAWSIATDGFKVLRDSSALDDLISTPSTQAYGSWEYRFRFPAIGNNANLRAGFYLFLDSAGPGGNGYRILVSAGTGSSKTVSLYRVDGASETRIIGGDANWVPNTAFHGVRANRAADGRFDLYLDGLLVGTALENTYTNAASTAIRHLSSNANTLRIDHVRMSSAATARLSVKLQVEVKPLGTAFDGMGLVESALVASGTAASVAVPAPVGSHHWRARVVDQVGNEGGYSSFGGNAEMDADFTRIPSSPPPSPSSLAATPGDAQVVLTWGASAGAVSYTVKRSTIHGTGYGEVATGIIEPSYTDSAVLNGTTYYYVITALGPGGESAASTEASATPQGVPDAPTGLSAVGGDNQVFLSWIAPSGVVTYVVQRGSQTGGPYATIATGVVPTGFTDNAALNGTAYSYVVRAQNVAGIGAASNEASATPSGPPPAPANFTGTALSPTSILWSWSDVAGETAYRLHDDGHALKGTSAADAATFTEAGLLENTVASRHVHAMFGVFEGAASNSKMRATLVHDALAADFVLARPALAQIDITVMPPPNGSLGSTGVQIERSSDGATWMIVKPFSRVWVHHDIGIATDANYAYRIRFQNADGVPSQASPAVMAPLPPPPGAPAGVTLAPILTTILQMKWQNVPENQGYDIHDENHVSQGMVGPHVTVFTKDLLQENTAYAWHVHALGPAGPGAPSATATAYTGVHTPFGSELTLSFAAPFTIQVGVTPPPNPAAGVTGCEIQKQMESGWVTVKPFSNTYSFVDGPLPHSTTHAYQFRYQNGDGRMTSFSPIKSLKTPVAGIPPPDGFAGAGQSPSSILWSWNNVAGEDGFVVKDDSALTIATFGPDVLSYLETGLAENNVYGRRVFARVGDGLSVDVSRASRYTLIRTAIAADFGVTATSMSTIDIVVVEPPGAHAGATGVRIERSMDGATWASLPMLAGLYLYSDAGLRGSTAYQYRIQYVNGDGLPSGVSPVRSVTTPQGTVGLVTGVTATGGDGKITLQWTPNTEPALAGYNVYRSATSGGPYSKVNGALLTATMFVDTSIAPSAQFYYVVRAQDSAGAEGGNSNEVSATANPIPAAPVISAITALSDSSIRVVFSTSEAGTFSFELHDDDHVVKGSLGPSPGGGATLMITETGLTDNARCSRHVHAIRGGIQGTPSNASVGYTLVHNARTTDFTLTWNVAESSVTIMIVPPPNPTLGSTGVQIDKLFGCGGWTRIANLTGVYNYTDPGVNPSIQYAYAITYVNVDGIRSATSPPNFIISPRGVPTSMFGDAWTPTSILWSWSTVPNATRYYLHDNAHTQIADITDTVYLQDGLQENTAYSRHAHAVVDFAAGDASPTVVCFTRVHDPAATDFTLTALSGSEVRIDVIPPPGSANGATGCEIQRLDGTLWTVVKSFSGSYSLIDGGLNTTTTYSYRIRYQNGDARATQPSAAKTILTGPPLSPAPGGFAGVALSPFSIQWSWNSAAGAESYVLHDAAHNDKGTAPASQLSFVETGLLENALVGRHVHAVAGGWLSAASPGASPYTLVHDALGVDLVLTALAGDAIEVAVVPPPQPTSGQTGCLISRSADGVVWTTLKAFSSEYRAVDIDLTRSTTYFYRVTFRNGDGMIGLTSPPKSGSTLSVFRPVITTGSKKTRNRNTTIQGTADPGAGVTVFFNGIADGGRVAGPDGTWSYTATTKGEGTYSVFARASSGAQQTIDSNVITVTIDLTPPEPPTKIRTTAFNNAVDVEWDPSPSSDVVGYLVYRREVGAATWASLTPTKIILGTRFRDATAVNGRRYAFKVTAVDDARND